MKYFSSIVYQSRWQVLFPVNPDGTRQEMAWFKRFRQVHWPRQTGAPWVGGDWTYMDSTNHKDCKRIRILTAICQDEYSSSNCFLQARICSVLLFQVNDVQIMQVQNHLSFPRGIPHDLTLVTSRLKSQIERGLRASNSASLRHLSHWLAKSYGNRERRHQLSNGTSRGCKATCCFNKYNLLYLATSTCHD